MKIELRDILEVDLKEADCGDFIVNGQGELRQIILVDEGYVLVDPADGRKCLMYSETLHAGLYKYADMFEIKRIIKSEKMKLVEC